MKYVNWNRTRALAAVCAMVILLSATGLTAFADNVQANQADLQQGMRMGPQGRNKMQGGPRQDEQRMPFGKQDGEFTPPADGEQPPEKPDGDFAPPADGEQPPEKPDGDFAPPADGEQPPEKPEGEDVHENQEDSETTDQAEQNTSAPENFFGRMRRHFRQRFSSKKAS